MRKYEKIIVKKLCNRCGVEISVIRNKNINTGIAKKQKKERNCCDVCRFKSSTKSNKTKPANCKTCNAYILINIRAKENDCVCAKCKKKSVKDNWHKYKLFGKKKENVCVECNNKFLVGPKEKSKKYCSENCLSKHRGGYREGSGRSYSGRYKGIFCGSSYELAWVIYNLDHGIDFERFDGFLQNDKVKYIPDFYIRQTNTIVEIKGFVTDQQKLNNKIQLAQDNGYNISILFENDLRHIFKYVKSKYGNDFIKLYENKSCEKVTCKYCSNLFAKKYNKNFKNIYCSRKCAALGNKTK
jgi:hypothetical protein